MKILQLIYESSGSPFGFGGAGVRANEIYKRLKERHDITLLCMKYPGARNGEIEGLRHIFVGTESKSLTKSVISYTLRASGYIRKYGRDNDIIIENLLPATPFFSRFLTKTPVILQIQGIMNRHALSKYNIFYSMPMYITEKVYPFLYDNFIFVTGIKADKLMRKAKKYVVIPNGIGRELLNIDEKEDDYILFFSRIDIYTKGLDILLDAFTSVADKYEGIKLVLAGYEFNSAARLLNRMPARLKDRVNYAGFVTGKEKTELLSRAKVFVLPSRHEAHPVSLLEALACGKAVLVSDIPELQYVRENGIGLSFKSGSSLDLADRLCHLLENKDLRERLGNRGRQYASNFLWDDIAPRFEKFLMDVTVNPNNGVL
ncbi:MAG: glycosyltransferase family 4 protein [Nitrospirota bacterium]